MAKSISIFNPAARWLTTRDIIALAKSCRMEVIAKDGEKTSQHDLLRAMDYRMAQGYLYRHPLLPEQTPQVVWQLSPPASLHVPS